MMRWYQSLTLTVLLALASGVSAGEQPRQSYQLDAVVVSATRSEIKVFDAPQSVTVLSEEEIMASPFERIEDILRFTVGFENHSHYGQQTGGVSSHFSMRGVGRNRVLMVLDGVPLNDNFSNSITWVAWGLIPKEAIARIEIVRGPTSAVYGSEGLGGVIHIITKKPAKNKEGSVKFTAGSAQTCRGSGFYSQKFERFGFLAAGGYEESDGYYISDPEDIEDYTKRRYRDVGKGFGKVTYAVDDRTDIDFSALYYQHEMGKGTEYFYDDAMLDQYRLGMTRRGEKMDWSGLVYLNQAEKTANIADTATYDRLIRQEIFPDNKVWGVGLQNTARLFDRLTLTTGMDYKYAVMDYDEDYPVEVRDFGATGRQETLSPFLDLTAYILGDKLVLNGGLRYSHIRNFSGGSWDTKPPNRPPFDMTFDSKTWEDFSPKAGIVFHPDSKTTLRTSVGTGFKSPSLFDLYKVHSRSNWSIRFANPELGPEKIVTWDIGGDRLFFNKLLVKAAYYQSWAKDYIGSRTINSYYIGTRLYTETMYDNVSKMDIHGVEAELDYEFGYGLTSFFNYTYNISKITEDEVNNSLEGKYLPGDPRHKYRFGFRYVNPDLINGSLAIKYNAHEYMDSANTTKSRDYLTLDLSVWKKIGPVSLSLNVENVTDEDEEIEDGTLCFGSIAYHF